MELLTLASSAITMAIPYLIKSGEAIAEKVGEDIWDFVKSIFTSEEQDTIQTQISQRGNHDEVIQLLIERLNENSALIPQLENAVLNGQNQLSNNQTIVNNGTVEKQINITQNSGNIQM